MSSTKVVTGIVRFSYCHVWEPSAIGDSEEEKYSVSLLIPKTDTKTIAKINAATAAALAAGKDKKFGGKVPKSYKKPLRDGDDERPDDEAYEGMYFLNANSKRKPQIVDRDVNPILDQDEFYSGCWGRADINFFAYNSNGSKGVAVALNNLQKVRDDEPLGAVVASAAEVFSAFEGMDDDDLLG